MGGNMSSGPKTRRRKNWTRERREFTELNGETADKVERKIAGNMRHRPTVYQCLIVGAQTTSARSIAIAQLHGARAVQTLRRRGAGDMPPGSTRWSACATTAMHQLALHGSSGVVIRDD